MQCKGPPLKGGAAYCSHETFVVVAEELEWCCCWPEKRNCRRPKRDSLSAHEKWPSMVRVGRFSALPVPVPLCACWDGKIYCVQPVACPTCPPDLRTSHFLCER